MKIVLLNLRKYGDKFIIGYNLTGLLSSYFCHTSPTLEIKLESGTIYLSKWAYLNRYKIYQSPIDRDLFFMAFQYKKPDNKIVLERLLRHAEKQKAPTIKPRTKHRAVA